MQCKECNNLEIYGIIISDKINKKIYMLVHSKLDIVIKSVRPFLFTILNNSLYQM